MKSTVPALLTALFLTSCAGVRVTRTEIATGAANPSAIYIRPFSVAYAKYSGYPSGNGNLIRKSQAPVEFAQDLQEELGKIAPARVLKRGDEPEHGWVVEGEFDVIDANWPVKRAVVACQSGYGGSRIKLHVRVIDLDAPTSAVAIPDGKGGTRPGESVKTAHGNIVYEFDVAGGSEWSGGMGAVYAPGLGNPIPFDFRNASERIMLALSIDPFRYGYRSTPTRTY